MHMKKTRLLLITLGIIFLTSLVLADSYSLEGEELTFTISSNSQGVDTTAYLMQDQNKIATITLCDQNRCSKSITKTLTLTTSGDYKIVYYDFKKFSWSEISFSYTAPPPEAGAEGIGAESLTPPPTETGDGEIKPEPPKASGDPIVPEQKKATPLEKLFIEITCRLSNFFNNANYQDCLDTYL